MGRSVQALFTSLCFFFFFFSRGGLCNKINRFTVRRSVALGTRTRLCKHHLATCPQERARPTPCPHPPPPPPPAIATVLCGLWTGRFWLCPVAGVTDGVSCAPRLSLSNSFEAPPHCSTSGLCSFSWVNSVPLHGQATPVRGHCLAHLVAVMKRERKCPRAPFFPLCRAAPLSAGRSYGAASSACREKQERGAGPTAAVPQGSATDEPGGTVGVGLEGAPRLQAPSGATPTFQQQQGTLLDACSEEAAVGGVEFKVAVVHSACWLSVPVSCIGGSQEGAQHRAFWCGDDGVSAPGGSPGAVS